MQIYETMIKTSSLRSHIQRMRNRAQQQLQHVHSAHPLRKQLAQLLAIFIGWPQTYFKRLATHQYVGTDFSRLLAVRKRSKLRASSHRFENVTSLCNAVCLLALGLRRRLQRSGRSWIQYVRCIDERC